MFDRPQFATGSLGALLKQPFYAANDLQEPVIANVLAGS